jgi:2-polyprenyl-6-methoxyphenol hydroxylase-like FAD-dependent oxidoreductase
MVRFPDRALRHTRSRESAPEAIALRIGIIGCGVAGQAAGIALARDGHDVTIVERFAQARPVGAGLLLQPSGLLALDRLGLREAAEAWGTPVTRLYGRTVRGRMVMDLRYAKIALGAQGLGIHRAALFTVLHDALLKSGAQLRLGFDVCRIADDGRLTARDGREEGPFDLILDCAGAHDALRNTLGARLSDPVYPWGALWTVCADRTGAFGGELRQVCESTHTMIGILPIGRAPDADGDHVAFFWSVRLADFERQKAAGIAVLKARILSAWPQAAPIVAQIESFEQFSLASYRDVRMKPWRKSRVLAIGDAAHGTSPQLGQGANLALIDAITIASVLRKERDIDAALAHYERLRRPHLRFYQLASRALTPAFQSDSRILGWLRDMFLGPLGRLPGIDRVMRTTLSGVRLFPFGLWRPPD